MRPIDDKLRQICRLFRIPGNLTSWEEIKVGNVNRTYKVTCRQDGGRAKSYIVQRINTYAFRQPVLVMENIDKVTEHIRAKCPDRVALHFHHTADRKNYVSDEDGFWRLFNYVPSVTYNTTENLSVIRSAGEAFGDFQTQLGDFDVQQLHYTIPDFHDTRKRYAKLKEDAAADPQGRAGQAREEIDWLLSVEDRACALTDLYDRGELPLRVTHNDTKINNVLFDAETDRAIVVIDLDTVMPGLSAHDFGDTVRFGANDCREDEEDQSKVHFLPQLYRVCERGFLSQAGEVLTAREKEVLRWGAKLMTLECGMRFLTDYLQGDVYFKIARPDQNLDRARTQFTLVQQMEACWDELAPEESKL